ncbi:Mur ligase domain-containing protein [Tunturiibacter gelidiferens]|uniref:Mur ligase domain-containing protein n=1 Tax=Tunturiibacter gelidiferens TaxID=3069689 RepID=UPI003D9B7477
MNWETVCNGLSSVDRFCASVEISGVEYDSRRVERGDVFVAMRGEATDGNRYLEAAIAKGLQRW